MIRCLKREKMCLKIWERALKMINIAILSKQRNQYLYNFISKELFKKIMSIKSSK